MDESTVTVVIQGRHYSLRVAEADKGNLQSAAMRIDKMANDFGRQFPNKDMQDRLAMAALIEEVQLVKLQQRQTVAPAVSQPSVESLAQLEALDQRLDQLLADD